VPYSDASELLRVRVDRFPAHVEDCGDGGGVRQGTRGRCVAAVSQPLHQPCGNSVRERVELMVGERDLGGAHTHRHAGSGSPPGVEQPAGSAPCGWSVSGRSAASEPGREFDSEGRVGTGPSHSESLRGDSEFRRASAVPWGALSDACELCPGLRLRRLYTAFAFALRPTSLPVRCR
jgi:hypothetical protein